MLGLDFNTLHSMTVSTLNASDRLISRLVSSLLQIRPLFKIAKQQARTLMIKRAATIGLDWHQEVQALNSRGGNVSFASEWEMELSQVSDPSLSFPDYYRRPFHAYDQGNLSWQAAMEVEVAAQTVHAGIWPEAKAQGDARLRDSYHTLLKSQLSAEPQAILDLGCSVGMSTFTLQALFPNAQVTGLDLSPYFLAIAQYRAQQRQYSMQWVHAAAESIPRPDQSFDLVSACLLFHELPQTAALQIIREARRLLRPSGHLAIMDMNPRSQVYATMPPYILTLLKSTEPYIDQYFTLNLEQVVEEAGFKKPSVTSNSPRHRTLVAQVRD
jgi:ubiquinone/menaquinone biosynthesis C-methylase UbiE